MVILGAVIAYLLGSIPSAVWYGRVFYKVDVRTLGSGNAGATNTLRNLGKTAGIIVLIIDMLKGYLAVSLVDILPIPHNQDLILLKMLFGFLAIIGHIFPVFAKFRGGKGVATALGVMLTLLPMAALLSIIVFIFITFSTHYVSLGSLLAAVAFPISAFFLSPPNQKYSFLIFGILIAAIIIIKHKKNIDLLLQGKENKFGAKKV